MDFIVSTPLSLTTVLIVLCVPFVYFAYHAKYWYHTSALRRLDFLLSIFCVLLALLVLYKLAMSSSARNWDYLRLHLMHLAPLLLTLLVVQQGRGKIRSQSTGSSRPGDKNDIEYRPVPLNSEIEQLGWSDLVIDRALQEELMSVVQLLQDPKTAHRYGIEPPKGILLNGPPGTGKTTIAKVMANIAGLSFFVLKTDEIVSKWVGESEKNLSKLFQAAQRHAPAVIFIDEVDSIGKSRSSGSQQWAQNLLNHLLQLVDGVVKTEGLYVIAATNRADLVDSALKRAGRLNRVIEISLPGFEARGQLFALYLSKLTVEPGLNIAELAQITEGRSPADIRAICNQAGLNAFKRESGTTKRRDYTVRSSDIQQALQELLKS